MVDAVIHAITECDVSVHHAILKDIIVDQCSAHLKTVLYNSVKNEHLKQSKGISAICSLHRGYKKAEKKPKAKKYPKKLIEAKKLSAAKKVKFPQKGNQDQ